MRWLLGEMGELLLEGQHAVPAAARRAGYVIRFPTLQAALLDPAETRSWVSVRVQESLL